MYASTAAWWFCLQRKVWSVAISSTLQASLHLEFSGGKPSTLLQCKHINAESILLAGERVGVSDPPSLPCIFHWHSSVLFHFTYDWRSASRVGPVPFLGAENFTVHDPEYQIPAFAANDRETIGGKEVKTVARE